MQYACTYVLIPQITILGHSDHKTGITIEFPLKFDPICMYICPDSTNYHIRSLRSQNWYHNWIPTEIWSNMHVHMSWFQKITILAYPNPKTGIMIEFPLKFHIRLQMSSPESIQSPILRSVWAHWRVSTVQYSGVYELTGEYPEHNTQVCMSSMDTLQISILNYGKLIGHPPEFNIQLQ